MKVAEDLKNKPPKKFGGSSSGEYDFSDEKSNEEKLVAIKPTGEDGIEQVMQKISKSKELFEEAEKEVLRLESEITKARDFRSAVAAEHESLKTSFGNLSKIMK